MDHKNITAEIDLGNKQKSAKSKTWQQLQEDNGERKRPTKMIMTMIADDVGQHFVVVD